MAYVAWSVVFGEQPSAAKWNILGTNDASFNDGSGIASSAITTAKIADDAVTAAKIDWAATGANGGIWFEELGRTTLGVAGDTISVTSIPARKYLKIYVFASATGGTINCNLRFNNDTGANYANRSSTNGAADGTGASATAMGLSATTSTNHRLVELEVLNVTAFEKVAVGHTVEADNTGGASTAARADLGNKWANTAAQITRVDIINVGAGDFAIGSECVVLGHN